MLFQQLNKLVHLQTERSTSGLNCQVLNLIIMKFMLVLAEDLQASCDRLEVRTLRCGRNNPGSNPGHGNFLTIKSTCMAEMF